MCRIRIWGNSLTGYAESTNTTGQLVDEDDQKKLVESLRRDSKTQNLFFQNVFFYGIGGPAIIFSLVLPLLCREECTYDGNSNHTKVVLCWSHSIYSSLLHAWTVYALTTDTCVRIIIFQTVPILIWITGNEDYLHFTLLISNAITFITAQLLYWDRQSTEKQFEELNRARYKHKEL